MLVLVMLVVHVDVLVLDRRVRVSVLVSRAKEDRYSCGHHQKRDHIDDARPFTE